MTCPSELILSLYADGELPTQDVASIDAHLADCGDCRTRLAALRAEVAIMAAALGRDAELHVVPAFERPASYGVMAATAILLLAATGLISATPALIGFSLPAPLAWLNPFDTGRLIDVAIRVAMFLAEYGGAIMTTIIQTVTAVVVTGFAAWGVLGLRSRLRNPSLMLCLVCLIAALPTPSHALEIRHVEDGTVSVPATETVADTLIAVGETVEVDGTIEGDLIAIGRRVAIRGHVTGQVFTAGSTISLDGELDGSVIGAAKTLDASSGRIGRNLFGFGESVTAGDRLNVEQNAVLFGERAHFGGPVGRDAVGFGEEIEVGNSVGGDVTAYGQRVTLLAPSRITGDVTAHVPKEDNFTMSPGAVVGGEVVTKIIERHEARSEYSTGKFWMFQLLRFAAGFATGAVLLALVPSLRRASLDTARSGFVAAGLGLVALVAVPMIAVLVAITVIGIPLSLAGLMLWVAGIYLSKIVMAQLIGARLIEATGQPRHYAAALAAGLLLVIVVVNLPFVGGLLNFILTITGLGLLLLFVWRSYQGVSERA